MEVDPEANIVGFAEKPAWPAPLPDDEAHLWHQRLPAFAAGYLDVLHRDHDNPESSDDCRHDMPAGTGRCRQDLRPPFSVMKRAGYYPTGTGMIIGEGAQLKHGIIGKDVREPVDEIIGVDRPGDRQRLQGSEIGVVVIP